MRNLVIDFDLTVLWPLILFALVVLISSVRLYLATNRDCKAAEKRLAGTFESEEEGEKFLEWGRSRCDQKREAKGLIWFSAVWSGVLCVTFLMPDRVKTGVAFLAWTALSFAATVSFVVAISMAWHYAKKSDWLKFWVCLVVMLLAATSAKHFFFQSINSRHVVCPHCSDDDERPEDM